jgi:hypothetical protein
MFLIRAISRHIFDSLITLLQLSFQFGSLIFTEIGQRRAWPSDFSRVRWPNLVEALKSL